jgi:hypothetical protein
MSLKKRMNAKAVLKTPSATRDKAEFREILDGHCTIATGAQKTVVSAMANPLIAIPSTNGRFEVTIITA